MPANKLASVFLLVMLAACSGSSSDQSTQDPPEAGDSSGNGGSNDQTSPGGNNGGSNPPSTVTRIDSATMCAGLVTDKEPVTIASLAKPAPMTRYDDPALGATVIRITNARSGEVIKPVYNTIQAFNADESLLMLPHR